MKTKIAFLIGCAIAEAFMLQASMMAILGSDLVGAIVNGGTSLLLLAIAGRIVMLARE